MKPIIFAMIFTVAALSLVFASNGVSAALPIGYLDSADCNSVTGWTCDPDIYAQSIYVHIYADGSAPANYVDATFANIPREPAVEALCNGRKKHGFSFTVPESLKDGNLHTIDAYAINIDQFGGPGGTNPLLTVDGPQKTITCTPPCTDTCESLGYECSHNVCGVWTDCGTCVIKYSCSDATTRVTSTPTGCSNVGRCEYIDTSMACPTGCSGGVCNDWCSDPDGRATATNAASTTERTTSYTTGSTGSINSYMDTCSGTTLREYYCQSATDTTELFDDIACPTEATPDYANYHCRPVNSGKPTVVEREEKTHYATCSNGACGIGHNAPTNVTYDTCTDYGATGVCTALSDRSDPHVCCIPESDTGANSFCSYYGITCGSYTDVDNCGYTRTINCGSCCSDTDNPTDANRKVYNVKGTTTYTNGNVDDYTTSASNTDVCDSATSEHRLKEYYCAEPSGPGDTLIGSTFFSGSVSTSIYDALELHNCPYKCDRARCDDPPTPVTVRIYSVDPLSGALTETSTIKEGQATRIIAYAEDDFDLDNIKIYVDDTLKKTCSGIPAETTSYTCIYDTPIGTAGGATGHGVTGHGINYTTGTHKYNATATDVASQTTESSINDFNITNPNWVEVVPSNTSTPPCAPKVCQFVLGCDVINKGSCTYNLVPDGTACTEVTGLTGKCYQGFCDTWLPNNTLSIFGTFGTNNWYVSPVNAFSTCNDLGSECNTIHSTVDNEISWTPYPAAFTPFTQPLNIYDGIYIMRTYSSDNAALDGLKTGPYPLNVDATLPQITVTGNLTWQKTDMSADMACSDSGSGCNTSTYRLRIYGLNPGLCPINYTSYDLVPLQIIPAYAWVCAAAKDNAGNLGISIPTEFKIYRIPPVTTITFDQTPDVYGWYGDDVNGPPYVTLSCKSTYVPCKTAYRIDGQSGNVWRTYDAPFEINDGVHTLEYYSYDEAGNNETVRIMTGIMVNTLSEPFSLIPITITTVADRLQIPLGATGQIVVELTNNFIYADTINLSVSATPSKIRNWMWLFGHKDDGYRYQTSIDLKPGEKRTVSIEIFGGEALIDGDIRINAKSDLTKYEHPELMSYVTIPFSVNGEGITVETPEFEWVWYGILALVAAILI